MPSTTRRTVPPGVYWRRRLALLSAALVMVLGIGKVLGHFTDGSGGPSPSAAQAGATTSSKAAPTKGAGTQKGTKHRTGKGKGKHHGQHNGQGNGQGASTTATPSTTPSATPTPPPLPDPSGPCDDDDVYITPSVTSAIAGSPVTITLNLQTQTTAACTWQVSPKTVTMKITSGADDIWSSRECPTVIPTQDVVVRNVVATQVALTWNAKRSDEYCTDRTAWALPGYYKVYAAPFSGEATDVQFELTSPIPVQVTETATPTQSPTGTPSGTTGKHHHKHPH